MQLVLGVAGAAVGSAFGSPQIGWAIGSALGGMLGPTQRSYGPRLTDLKVTASDLGTGVPYIIGHPRVTGYVAWASDKREIATTTRQGKGGPSAESTSYTYEIDLLILLSANQIAGIRRIWSSGKLIWSIADASDEETIVASEDTPTWRVMRFHGGAANQLPDPTYEAAVGVGNAPAFRGRGTVMLEGLQLGSGGQLPNLTFEIASSFSSEVEYLSAGASLSSDGRTTTIDTSSALFGATFCRAASGWAGLRYIEHVIQGPVSTGVYVGVMGRSAWTGSDYPVNPYGSPSWVVNTVASSISGAGGTCTGWLDNGAASCVSHDIFAPGDVVGIAVDYDARTLLVTRNGIPMRQAVTLPSGDFDPYFSQYLVGRSVIANRLTAGEWQYAPAGALSYLTEKASVEPVALTDVVTNLCVRCGPDASDVDVSSLAGQMVHAMAVQPTSARAVLEQLATAYYFGCRESDKLYFVRRGGAPVRTIAYGAYGADALLAVQDANDLELPAQVNVSYLNLSSAYQQGNELSDRLTTDSTAVSSVQLGMGLTPAAAKAIADTAVLDQTIAARTASASLDMRYAALECDDVVLLEDVAGITHRMRIVKVSDSDGVRSLDLVGDDARVLRELGITSDDYDDDYTVLRLAGTDLVVLDIPLLRDQDDGPGVYAAGDGLRGRWPGYVLLRDGVEVGRTATGAAMGVVTEALGNWTSLLVDEANVITVTVNAGDELESITHADLSTGNANYAAIGAPGRWEIVQYQRAVLVSEGVYRLSGLARGRLGTEHLRGTHQAGDRFVALDGAGLLRDVGNLADIGMQRTYSGVTQGARIESGTEVQVVPTWQGLRPLSPVGARQLKQVNGDLAFQWGRRSRYVSNVLMGVLPLAEASERYEVDVLTGAGAVVRTLASTTPAVTYTAAQQVADFGAQQAAVAARIYQISASIGRGQPASL